MFYAAYFSREDEQLLVEFPDCRGCQTFADDAAEVPVMAQDALEGWLEAHLVDGKVPPKPSEHRESPIGSSLLQVPVSATLSLVLQLRWTRQAKGMTQGDVAQATGVSQQSIAKMERVDGNPSLATIEKIARGLGLTVSLDLREEAVTPATPARRERPRKDRGGAEPKKEKPARRRRSTVG